MTDGKRKKKADGHAASRGLNGARKCHAEVGFGNRAEGEPVIWQLDELRPKGTLESRTGLLLGW